MLYADPEHRRRHRREYRAGNSGAEKAQAAAYYRRNKATIAARAKARREADPAKYDHRARERLVNRLYRISLEERDALEAAQGGTCAICEKAETTTSKAGRVRRLAIDHCHTSGRVRGLLCGSCNRALGLFGDDPGLLDKAAKYLLRAA